MLWVMTGYSSEGDGLLYAIEAETEQAVYEAVAKIRKMKYVRVEKTSKLQPAAVKADGLDDRDVFSDELWFDILIYDKMPIPTWENLNDYEDFTGYVCCAGAADLNTNLSDLVQW